MYCYIYIIVQPQKTQFYEFLSDFQEETSLVMTDTW